MLTADQFDALADQITQLYTEYELSVITDIARRLKNLDFASAAWQVQRLTESGAVYKDVVKKLANITGKSEASIREILKSAGVKTIKFDDQIYKAAGLNPLPLNFSPAMLNTLQAMLAKTNGVVNNLTMTTALTAQQAFIKASDLAYMQVSTGVMSYDQAIRAAIKQVAADGLTTIDYASGHKDKLDVAIRRAVLTGVSQTAGQLQINRADELGVDLVAVSAHIGARNVGEGPANHESWQGQVYSRSGNNTQYPSFVPITGYGTIVGLAGVNCRHSFYPFFEGISENAYSKATLNEYARKTVTYNGQKMSVYEATQMQRGIERKIRYWKRQEAAIQAGGLESATETAKVKQWQATMRDFTKQTGLDRQRVRESVIITNGTPPPVVSAPVAPLPVTPAPVEVVAPVSATNGAPVSDALDLSTIKNKKVKTQVELAVNTIDKIHGDGVLPKIPVSQSGAGRSYGVFYNEGSLFSSNTIAKKISISPNGDHQALTAIHEIGHFIDHSGLGTGKQWTSQMSGFENNAIVKVAKTSNWWTGLAERVSNFSQLSDRMVSLSPRYVQYLQGSKEVFARAYAQFIAMESGDPILLAQLRSLQNQAFPTQWTDEDFAPIAEEFRKLFRERGWM